MSIGYWLFIGLLLPMLYAFNLRSLATLVKVVFWFICFLSAVNVMHFFNANTIYWLPRMGINFSFTFDGLSRMFFAIISSIGVIVFIYAQLYIEKEKRHKLLGLLQFFAISMCLMVLTDNLIILFLGWELTTVSSYFLIQFKQEDSTANDAALLSIILSVMGALCLLCAIILMHLDFNTWQISSIISQMGVQLPANTTAIFTLALIAIMSKSAQFPLHFWLPQAMKAPTPVSAYLHSATMVNAGIYLLTRLHPAFYHYAPWSSVLLIIGDITMLISAFIALFERDLKSIFAYSTIYSLGLMVYLLAAKNSLTIVVFCLYFIFHACYKAAGFMVIGIVDQEYKTRDITKLKGLCRKRLDLAILFLIILIAMAGLPPFTGFLIKVMSYEAKLSKGKSLFAFISTLLSGGLLMAACLRCLYYLFNTNFQLKRQQILSKMNICPIILLCIVIAMVVLHNNLLNLCFDISKDILVNAQPITKTYSITSIALNIVTIIIALTACYIVLSFFKKKTPITFSFANLFHSTINGFVYVSKWCTALTLEKNLRTQLRYFYAFFIILFIIVMPQLHYSAVLTGWWHVHSTTNAILYGLMLAFAFMLIVSNSITSAFIFLSLFGITISLYFIMNGAIDLAMTQLLIEILGIVILLLTCTKIQVKFQKHHYHPQSLVNLVLALCFGFVFAALIFNVLQHPFNNIINDYYIKNSMLLGFGRNVVNVVLVDFRALDTLGEVIVVITIAYAIKILYNVHNKRNKIWKNL